MNPRIALKVFIDVAMLVFYLQLMFCYAENPLYHEVVGIGIGALCLLHLALNRSGIAALSRKLGWKELQPRHLAAAVLDAGLVVTMVATIVTGMLVARDLYVGPCGSAVAEIHNVVSYVCLAIIAAHAIQHIPYLVRILRPRSTRTAAPRHADGASMPASTTAMVPLSAMPKRRASASDALSRRQFVMGSLVAASAVLAVGSTALLKYSGAAALSSSDGEASSGAADSGTDSSSNFEEGPGHGHGPHQGFGPGNRPDRSSDSGSSDSGSGSDSSSSDSGESFSGSSGDSDSGDSGSSSSTTVCTLCHKRCPISDLRCQKGVDWAQQNGLA